MRIRLFWMISIAACAGATRGPASPSKAMPSTTAASSYTTGRTGDVHDFDFLAGAWTLENHRLKVRGVGSNDWDEFPAATCGMIYLGGVANVDEIYFPTKGWSGLTVRTFNLKTRQWSIYWINSRDGAMFPPVVGGFEGDRGEFYGEDEDNGRPVKVRFVWTKLGPDRARWEQAFSPDGKTWEINWWNELVRTDAARCEAGRPKR